MEDSDPVDVVTALQWPGPRGMVRSALRGAALVVLALSGCSDNGGGVMQVGTGGTGAADGTSSLSMTSAKSCQGVARSYGGRAFLVSAPAMIRTS